MPPAAAARPGSRPPARRFPGPACPLAAVCPGFWSLEPRPTVAAGARRARGKEAEERRAGLPQHLGSFSDLGHVLAEEGAVTLGTKIFCRAFSARGLPRLSSRSCHAAAGRPESPCCFVFAPGSSAPVRVPLPLCPYTQSDGPLKRQISVLFAWKEFVTGAVYELALENKVLERTCAAFFLLGAEMLLQQNVLRAASPWGPLISHWSCTLNSGF